MDKICIKKKDMEKFDKRVWIKIINSLSGFKSANLIGTKSLERNSTNLAIISSVFHIGANPPLMGFVVRPHSDKSPRHSLLNIQETQSFTINHVNAQILTQAHQTSARYDLETSEFEACKLTEDYKPDFLAPFVKESHIQIGLKLIEVKNIEYNKTHIVIGEIERFYLERESLKADGFVDLEKLKTVAVSGLDAYYETIKLARLSYAKPNKKIEILD